MERLQRKFAMIHSTLAQQQAAKNDPETPKLRQSADGSAAMPMQPTQQQQQQMPLNASQASLAGAQNLNVSAPSRAAGLRLLYVWLVPSAWLCGLLFLAALVTLLTTCSISDCQADLLKHSCLLQASADMSKLTRKMGSMEFKQGQARGVLSSMR